MKITTNNQPRELVTWHDLSVAQREDFDYIAEDDRYSPRLFIYKGYPHDTNEFIRSNGELASWDGMQSDTFFSGVLVRYVDDFERVVVGSYFA